MTIDADAPVAEPAGLGAPQQQAPRRHDRLDTVRVQIEVVLGRERMPIGDVRKLHVGSTVELDRDRNDPVDVLVNGDLFAEAEVVVIEDQHLGVKITKIIGSEPQVQQ